MRKRQFMTAALLAGFMALGQAALFAETKLEPYIELELKRLEETYRLLDTYSRKIWPDWSNYMEIEFRVQYPNLVQLLVGPRDNKVPAGYELVPDRTLRGKKIYVNRKDELPIKVQPPLNGGGKGGLTIRIFMDQIRIDQAEADKAVAQAIAEKNFTFSPAGSSDNEIILYVHEFFHGYQRRAMMNRAEALEKARKEGKLPAEPAKPEEPGKRPAEDRDREGEGFQANAGYATYSNIEGLALTAAFMEKDKAKALESLKDYMVAREIKQAQFMTPEAAAEESDEALSEGSAVYANTRMLMLIRDGKYKPSLTKKDDPFFYGYRFADGKIAEDTTGAMERDKENTLSTLKCYSYGAYQCFALDRFFPGWNKGLYEKGLNLDQVTAARLKLAAKEKAAIAERLKTRYGYDKLYAKHAAVVTDRDEIMNIVKSRKGRTYIIDMEKTRDFVYAMGRRNGRSITVSVSGYYVNGIEDLKLGDIELTTWNTPIHKPFLYTIEWTDTEVKPDEKNYTFHYEKKEGDIYKNVIFTTPGFTLKAPEVRIREIKEKNQFRIDVLTKVSR